jgi:outer membrane protein TolC
MRRRSHFLRILGIVFLSAVLACAQEALTLEPADAGWLGWLTRPYQARNIAPTRLSNSPRLNALIRGGTLYLTAHDVVALAIENNIDIEVQRYTPLLAQQVLRRAEAGGFLRSVGLPVQPGPLSVSLQGVSVNTGGGVAGSSAIGISSGGGIVTQLGPTIPSLDPTLSGFVNFQHATTPQSNTVLTGTTALIQTSRSYQAQYAQNWSFGLSGQLTYSSNRIKVNSQFFNLNPFTNGSLDLQLTQNLLQGFGRAVNERNIRVQRNNIKVSELQFRAQVQNTISSTLNLYWDLVAFTEDVRSRRQAVTTAEQLLVDNRKRVELGFLAEIEITRAEAQVYATRQDLTIAQTNLLQQETILKNAIVRNGVADAGLATIKIVPLDSIAVPAEIPIRPIDDLVGEAAQNRIDIQQARINIESNQLNLVGIRNSLKPGLQAFVQFTNNGLTGELTPLGALIPGVDYLAGGYGNLLAQIFRRNYPNYSAGFSLNIPLRNRAAQADYAISALELRQNELNIRRSLNQVRVDVQNAVIGLDQAKARYEAASRARVLSEQTLSADQRKLELGASTPFQVIQDQRDVAAALSTEIQAIANFTHARIAYDDALGKTLEVNNVVVSDALKGRVATISSLPAELPKGAKQ